MMAIVNKAKLKRKGRAVGSPVSSQSGVVGSHRHTNLFPSQAGSVPSADEDDEEAQNMATASIQRRIADLVREEMRCADPSVPNTLHVAQRCFGEGTRGLRIS
jgi:hypothetical protein